MSFRVINLDIMLRGTILATLEKLFPAGIPSLNQFSKESGVEPSTFRRAALDLLDLLPEFLASRRPGPQPADEGVTPERQVALEKLEALKLWLVENRAPTKINDCYSGEAKQRIAHLSEEIQSAKIMSFMEIAEFLGMDERQLQRIRQEVKEAAGGAPAPESRRPHATQELAPQIQQLIGDIQSTGDSRDPYNATDIKRIIEAKYKVQLKEYHSAETISLDTVTKYMKKVKEEPAREHPRGNFNYPQPFQQVTLDTMHLKFFGMTFYFITVFELAGRLNLLTRVFLKESTEAVLSVIEESLTKYPSVEAAIIDRGTPYLNDEVKKLLVERGKLRLVAPPAEPTAKAAGERHFLTMREAIEPALASVFPTEPGWEREKLVKVLEFGVMIFQNLYHRIPQEGIDGKSPAERIENFDPAKACAASLALFNRSLDMEPAEEFARQLHQRFQLPGSEADTVSSLRQFGTRALRLAAEEVAPHLGPPVAKWIKEPLGFLAARAHEIRQNEVKEYLVQDMRQMEERHRRAEAEASKIKIQEEAREREENPERFVDSVLERLVTYRASRFPGGIKFMVRELKARLQALSGKLGAAFASEVNRLKTRIRHFTANVTVEAEVNRIIDGLVQEISVEKGAS
jgi:transposase-like protein